MALWRFVLLDLVGAVAYAGLVVGLGYAIWRQRRRRTRPSRGHGPNRGDTGAPWLTLRLCCSAIWSRCSQSVRNGHAEPRGPKVPAAAAADRLRRDQPVPAQREHRPRRLGGTMSSSSDR